MSKLGNLRLVKTSAISAMLIGLCILSQSLWIYTKAWAGQALIEAAWERSVRDQTHHKPWPWADTYPVGKLNIPSLNIELYLLQGDTGQALAFAPGMTVYETKLTNAPHITNTYLLQAHRDTHFKFLPKLKRGEQLSLEMLSEKKLFYVHQHKIFETPEFSTPSDLEHDLLLLSSCYPFANALESGADIMANTDKQRYVVALLPHKYKAAFPANVR